MPCVIPKGSVAVDGVSLTVARVHEAQFEVALIPTTLALTTLAFTDHGLLGAFVVIQHGNAGRSLGAEAASHAGIVGIAFNLDDPIVFARRSGDNAKNVVCLGVTT